MSTDHKNIHEAMLAAQRNFLKPAKSAENTHFKNKYATLDDVIDAVRPALNAEGVYLSQPLVSGELGMTVATILHHAPSGTELREDVPLLLGKQDMQQMKSASTYARRIGLENLTGLAPSDADDDAETNRQGTDMGAAIKDAWKQSVLDGLPEGATPRQTAEAFADAICADFDGKGEKALVNRWNKHLNLIAQFKQRFPDLHAKVVDVYENRMIEIKDAKRETVPE
jgi:hypothetical protein